MFWLVFGLMFGKMRGLRKGLFTIQADNHGRQKTKQADREKLQSKVAI